MARATYTNHVELGRLVTNTTVVYLAANSKLPCQDSRMESLESIFHFAEKGYYTTQVQQQTFYYTMYSKVMKQSCFRRYTMLSSENFSFINIPSSFNEHYYLFQCQDTYALCEFFYTMQKQCKVNLLIGLTQLHIIWKCNKCSVALL